MSFSYQTLSFWLPGIYRDLNSYRYRRRHDFREQCWYLPGLSRYPFCWSLYTLSNCRREERPGKDRHLLWNHIKSPGLLDQALESKCRFLLTLEPGRKINSITSSLNEQPHFASISIMLFSFPFFFFFCLDSILLAIVYIFRPVVSQWIHVV